MTATSLLLFSMFLQGQVVVLNHFPQQVPSPKYAVINSA
jgi:hypothetical protein